LNGLLSPTVVSAILFVMLMASAGALYAAISRDRATASDRLGSRAPEVRLRRRIRELDHTGSLQSRLMRWQTRRLREARARKPSVRALQSQLNAAGFVGMETVAAFYVLRTACLALGAATGIGIAAWSDAAWPLYGGCGALLGYAIPNYVLRRMAKRRRLRLGQDLPAAIDLMVVTLEAGLGMSETIRVVGREIERQRRALGKELSATAAEMSAGVSLADALRGLGERTGVDDIKALSALLIQSDKIGARLGPALRASAALMNSQRRLKAEEAAQRSAVKMLIPLVLLILPATMIVILGPALIQIVTLLTGA
jgi:tight adherence protein C